MARQSVTRSVGKLIDQGALIRIHRSGNLYDYYMDPQSDSEDDKNTSSTHNSPSAETFGIGSPERTRHEQPEHQPKKRPALVALARNHFTNNYWHPLSIDNVAYALRISAMKTRELGSDS